MNKYLIYGPSGVGKSAIGEELKKRGYRVIEADSEISFWVNKHTGQKVGHNPPFTQKWLDQHEWNWNEQKLENLLKDTSRTIFLVGGAHNMAKFMDLFDKKIIIYADFKTVLPRLKQREPDRWLDDYVEVEQLENMLDNFKVIPIDDTVFIKNEGSISAAADKILSFINEA